MQPIDLFYRSARRRPLKHGMPPQVTPHFLVRLPRSSVGKVQRRVVRDMIERRLKPVQGKA